MSYYRTICPKCGMVKGGRDPKTQGEMPDPCWGKLPGVLYGCCGHGVRDGYLVFTDGTKIEFKGMRVEKNSYQPKSVVNGYTYENTLPYNGPISVEEAEKYEGEKLEVCD